MTSEEEAQAETIVAGFVWQPYDGHNYSYAGATNVLTRFVEAASMQPDELKLVIAYLKNQTISGGIPLLNRSVDLGTGWKAKDAWFQTSAGDKWANTDSTRIRLFQVLIQAPDGSGQGPYVVENGCQYKVSHTFYWDVETLPTLTASSSGVEYTMQGVTRDRETGLWSCVIEKRERQQQDVSEYVTGETAFETGKEETHLGVKATDVGSTGKAASVGNGKRVRRRLTKNADCTSNVENETIVEKAVTGSRKAWRKTLRGIIATQTDRSQAAALNGDGLEVGETRTSEKTEGDLWNNTTEKTTKTPVGEIGAQCQTTIFEHQHTKTSNVADKPATEASTAGEGKTYQKTARQTEEGTWDVAETTTEEKAVSQARVIKRKTLRGTTTTTVSRNGTDSDTTVTNVGDEVSVEKTPGGRFTRTVTTVDKTPVGEIGAQCQTTIFEHQHTKTSNVADKPATEASTAGEGKTYQKTARQTEEGTWDVAETTTTENEVASARVIKRKTRDGIVTTTVTRNGTDADTTVKNVGDEVSVEKTPGGRYTRTSVSVPVPEPIEKEKSWRDSTGNYTLHEYLNAKEPQKPPSGFAKSTASFRINEYGLYDGSWTTHDTSSTSGESLAWNATIEDITSKIVYVNKSGSLVYRVVTGDKYICYGLARLVADAIKNSEDMPAAGWRSGMSMKGVDHAFGWKYFNLSVGAETPITTTSSNNSSSSS